MNSNGGFASIHKSSERNLKMSFQRTGFYGLEERAGADLYFKGFDETLHLREVIVGPRCTVEDDEIRSRVADHNPLFGSFALG